MLPVLFRDGARLNRLFDASLFPAEDEAFAHVPAHDIDETENGYQITLDLPGVAKEDLKLSLEGRTLTIEGSRKAVEAVEGKYSQRHRWTGEFVRTFDLGEEADGSKVEASLKDGVLRVTVAKAETAMPRVIPIQ